MSYYVVAVCYNAGITEDTGAEVKEKLWRNIPGRIKTPGY